MIIRETVEYNTIFFFSDTSINKMDDIHSINAVNKKLKKLSSPAFFSCATFCFISYNYSRAKCQLETLFRSKKKKWWCDDKSKIFTIFHLQVSTIPLWVADRVIMCEIHKKCRILNVHVCYFKYLNFSAKNGKSWTYRFICWFLALLKKWNFLELFSNTVTVQCSFSS